MIKGGRDLWLQKIGRLTSNPDMKYIYKFTVLCWIMILYGFTSTSNAQDRPNIILILADDLGFSDLGSYGGEVQTPNLNKLASNGIRYKQFYNGARCCPTRASLLTGVYPHQAGMGWMAAADLGTPAYQGNLNDSCVTIAEVLKDAGYSTYMTGKWHLTNERKIDGMVKDNWPIQRGFDKYFGIIPGGANYYTPVLYSGNDKYKAPGNFFLTTAITDTSVKFIDEHFEREANKPMFMYVSYTAPHWPLHALEEDIDRYKEIYKAGWDSMRRERFERQKRIGLFPENAVMSSRDPQVDAWDSLSEEEKSEMAMRMAIYAAQIDVMDRGIGEIVAKLKEKGQLDNTLIFFLSDNGACAEYISSGDSKEVNGKPNTFESYRIQWANVSSTPFKEYKHYTYEGGIATPLIVHWPNGVKAKMNNQFVSEYGHMTDIMATCLEVANAIYPTRYSGHKIVSLQGKSLLPHFYGQENSRGKVYWEHEANIAMRDGKWKLVSKTPEDSIFSKEKLALYDMDKDPIEMNNLATIYPEKVKEMYGQWVNWAKDIGVFSFDTRNYNLRAQGYRNKINGDFEEDNLGGWNIVSRGTVEGSIELDSTSLITGRNSVKVSVNKTGERPANLGFTWRFFPKKGERYKISLNTMSNKQANYLLRLEKPNGGVKLIDQTVTVSDKLSAISSPVIDVSEDGPYLISLYFGKLNDGDRVWLDDINLVKIK